MGFISDLPTTLIAAFRATLEEVLEADLILHVRDIADATSASQRADVNAVLAELGIDAEGEPDRMLEVWNKADLLDAAALQSSRNEAAPRRRRAGLGRDGVGARCARAPRSSSGSIARARRSRSRWARGGLAVELDLRELRSHRAQADLGEGVDRLAHPRPPEKRDKLARLAGAARLQLAAE